MNEAKFWAFFLSSLVLIFTSCVSYEEPTKSPISEDQNILESAKIWFGPQDEFQIPNALDISAKGRVQTKKIKWENAIVHEDGKIIEVQVDYNYHAVPTRGEESKDKIAQKQKDSFYRLILISDGDGGYKKSMLKFFPEESKSKQKDLKENSFLKLSSDFSGSVRLFSWDEQFLRGWNVKEGSLGKYISPINQKGKRSKIASENLSQDGCSGSFVEEYYCYHDGDTLDCTPIFVMQCEQEQNYDESPDGGGYDSPSWSQTNWHGFWPGFGSGFPSEADWQNYIAGTTDPDQLRQRQLAYLKSHGASEFVKLIEELMAVSGLEHWDVLEINKLVNQIYLQQKGKFMMAIFSPENVATLLSFGLYSNDISTIARNTYFKLVSKYASPANIGKGFSSFTSFKTANGVAGTGKQWHHIVSQRASNITKFGSNQIHNSKNLIKIEGGFSGSWHTRITSFYNSKSPMGVVNTGDKTFGQWVAEKSFQEQMEWGLKVMNLLK